MDFGHYHLRASSLAAEVHGLPVQNVYTQQHQIMCVHDGSASGYNSLKTA
jgi:hypothetical protein